MWASATLEGLRARIERLAAAVAEDRGRARNINVKVKGAYVCVCVSVCASTRGSMLSSGLSLSAAPLAHRVQETFTPFLAEARAYLALKPWAALMDRSAGRL